MKKKIFFPFIICLFSISSYSQTLDRVALSPGGLASDSMSATIGEVFNFSRSGGGNTIDAGSQSDNGNSGQFLALPEIPLQGEIKAIVFPNPVVDMINLKIPDLQETQINLVIFDAGGRQLLEKSANGETGMFSFNVKALLPGNYLVKVQTKKGLQLHPFVFIKS